MTIVLASNNRHKIEELRTMLQDALKDRTKEIQVLSLAEIGFTEDIVENGNTFEENALIKANAVAKRGYIAIADDSGLSVDALNGAPGVYSARYAGEPCNDRANNEKLLRALENCQEGQRTAHFVSVIACVFPETAGKAPLLARGECPGVILRDYQGNGGFGYDPLFYYEPLQKTFAQLTSEEKNSISHRARAMALFLKRFCDALE